MHIAVVVICDNTLMKPLNSFKLYYKYYTTAELINANHTLLALLVDDRYIIVMFQFHAHLSYLMLTEYSAAEYLFWSTCI